MILTKWKYLELRCLNENSPAAAKVAKEIDSLLNRIGLDRSTKLWRIDYQFLDEYSITEIAGDHRKWCMACEKCNNRCDDCEFAARGGTILYNDFRKLINR